VEFDDFKRHILRPTVSADMVPTGFLWWERQKRCFGGKKRQGLMAEKCCYDEFSVEFLLGKRR
jgi:hypothetical protein